MILSLLGALAASVCFGVATVLQAIAARRAPSAEGVDPRLLVRLASQLPFLAGLALDLSGFVLELAALRTLPLFVVQAVIAANLAVTAVVASKVMGLRLSRVEWGAVAVVCLGLALLGSSADKESPEEVGAAFRWTLLASAASLLLLGLAAGRLTGTARAVTLGTLAGLAFGVVAIGARVVTDLAPLSVLTDPAAWSVALAGLTALLLYSTALQKGSVTATTAAVVVAETVMPAAVGILLLHDTTRPGLAPLAIAGFVLAVLGTLTLARFGEPST
ncbi:hypothetical protein [Actinocorallia longicatena]|uniref:Integral membrane protein n=1 Tax=Actinocorallia longicatena TaxID=111803 RepID=A0ABP6QFZ2_9ACTN